MQFPIRDLTNQYISLSYQDVVQRYAPTGSNTYLLDGYGYVIGSVPNASIGGQILTTDQTASWAVSASWAPGSTPTITASYADFAKSASWAPGVSSISSSYAESASAAISASYANLASLALVADVALIADTASVASQADTASYISPTIQVNTSSYANFAKSASWSEFANSASWAPATVIPDTSSYADFATSASWAPMPAVSDSSSWASSSVSASYADRALSASFADWAWGADVANDALFADTASYSDFAQSTNTSETSSHLDGDVILSGSITAHVSQSTPAWKEGSLFWDSGNHTYALYNDVSDITLQIGQETLVRVAAGENIPNGSPVYISASLGTYPLVKLALADGNRYLKYAVAGIATHTISSGSYGYITVQGRVNDVDTSAFPASSPLFLSHLQSGSFIAYPPPQPYERVVCGYSMYQDASAGKILVGIVALPEAVNVSVGMTSVPSISSGSMTPTGSILSIGTASVNLCTTADGKGTVKNYNLPSASFAVTTSFLDAQYVVATYNSGSPRYAVIGDRSSVDSIQTTLVYTMTVGTGGSVSYTGWDAPGTLLANKLLLRTENVYGPERENGLTLAESGSRYFTIQSGSVWQGVNEVSLPSMNSRIDRVVLVSNSGSWYSGSFITQFTNTLCDNGSGPVPLGTGTNHWVVNYVYRGLGNLNTTVVMYSPDYTSLAAAQQSQPPMAPPEMADFTVLVGRAIYRKNVTPAVQVDSAFIKNFTPSVQAHNDLLAIQGGAVGEYYHLTSAEYTGSNNGTGPFVRQTGSLMTGSVITGSITSASYATTSSYAPTSATASAWQHQGGQTYQVGNLTSGYVTMTSGQTITNSSIRDNGAGYVAIGGVVEGGANALKVNGNVNITGYITASAGLIGTASRADSSSYSDRATTASYAENIQLNGTDGYLPQWLNDSLTETSSIQVLDNKFVIINSASFRGADPLTTPALHVRHVEQDDNSYNVARFDGETDNYVQVTIQNFGTGSFSSADLVAEGTDGLDKSHYVDVGINCDTYNDPAFGIQDAGGGYLYVESGSLAIGTKTPGFVTKFHVGGTTADKEVARINEDNGFVIITGSAPTASWASSSVSSSLAHTASYLPPWVTTYVYSGSDGVPSSYFEPFNVPTGSYNPPYKQGRMFFSGEYSDWVYYTDQNFKLHVGKEVIWRCYNPSGSAIPTGTPVYMSGSTNGLNPDIFAAKADGTGTKSDVIGVVRFTIPSGSTGYVLQNGVLHDVDMTGFSVGDPLYLGINGGLTNSEPGQPNESVRIGNCQESGANGSLIVSPVFQIPPSYGYSGMTSIPTLTDDYPNSYDVFVGSGSVNLYSNAAGVGNIKPYLVNEATFSVAPSLAATFLYVGLSGSVATYLTTSAYTDINGTTKVLVATLYRADEDVHWMESKEEGLALANKINKRLVETEKFRWESGFSIVPTGSNFYIITAGQVWFGATNLTQDEFDSRNTGSTNPKYETHWAYHSASVWTLPTQSNGTWPNAYYDNGTNLTPLSPNSWSVNYFFRILGENPFDEDVFIIPSNYEYTDLTSAQADTLPAGIPSVLDDVSIMVGRIIFQSGSATGTAESAFTTNFGQSSVTQHNALSGIQGGQGGEYYHLKADEYTGTGTGVMVRATNPTMSAPYFVGATQYHVPYWKDNQLTLTGSVIVSGDEHVLINSGSFPDPNNPEALLVYQKHTESVTTVGAYSTTNNFAQVWNQNLSSGSQASTDFCATADIGDQDHNYIDMGIASSGMNDARWPWLQPIDGYLEVEGGNLWLATMTTHSIKFAFNNTASTNYADSTGFYLSGSWYGTASWAESASHATFADSTTVSEFATSASWASSSLTASHVLVDANNYFASHQLVANNGLFGTQLRVGTNDLLIDSVGNVTTSGSVTASDFFGPLEGTASWATNTLTAVAAQSSSWASQSFSSSHALRANNADSASYSSRAISSSFALSGISSSYALRSSTADSASFSTYAISSSNALRSNNSDSSSYADYALSASWAPMPLTSDSSSWASASFSSSYALRTSNSDTSSYSTFANSASYAYTSSYAIYQISNEISASWASQSFSASHALRSDNADSTSFATYASSTNTAITTSWSENATSSSFSKTTISSSYAIYAETTNTAITTSWANNAVTASYALGMPIIKSGIVAGGSFGGTPRTASIVFTKPFPNNNYSVTVTGEVSRTWTILNKVSGSFQINSNNNAAFASNAFWQAISTGEFYS